MKFDIITLTYNSEETLLETLKSLKSQKEVSIHHIILDGKSKDQTLRILKKNQIKDTSKIIRNRKGIYKDLNFAIKKCRNDIVGILHSDDVFYSQNILKTIKKKFQNSKANVIYGDVVYINKNNKNTVRNWIANSNFYKNKVLNYIVYKNLIKKGWMPPHTSIFIKKKHLKKIGPYNENYLISSDYDFIIRTFKHKKSNILYMPTKIVKMKIGGISNKSIKNLIIKSCEDYQIIKRNNLGGFFTLLYKNLSKVKQYF